MVEIGDKREGWISLVTTNRMCVYLMKEGLELLSSVVGVVLIALQSKGEARLMRGG